MYSPYIIKALNSIIKQHAVNFTFYIITHNRHHIQIVMETE